MFAYVFWHVRPDRVDVKTYEDAMSGFGRALRNQKIDGVIDNSSYWVDKVKWVEAPGYEDWVWVDELSVFERLNERAVTGPMEQPHDKIAQMTKHGGYGSFYYLIDGQRKTLGDSRVFWLSRPRGIQWRDVMPKIIASATTEVSVWRRFMVLGPAPEFAIVGPADLQLTVPEGWTASIVDRRCIGGDAHP